MYVLLCQNLLHLIKINRPKNSNNVINSIVDTHSYSLRITNRRMRNSEDAHLRESIWVVVETLRTWVRHELKPQNLKPYTFKVLGYNRGLTIKLRRIHPFCRERHSPQWVLGMEIGAEKSRSGKKVCYTTISPTMRCDAMRCGQMGNEI